MDFGKGVSRRAKTQFELDREGLVFASAYTFAKVMADNPDLARRFAERLLGIQIGALEFFEVEMDIPTALRKSVRMDAILAGSGKVVEIEMQSERDASLERRLRYYQAMIDSRSLGKGQMYRDLPELYMLAMPVPPPLSLRCRGPVFLPKPFSPRLWAMIGKPSTSNTGSVHRFLLRPPAHCSIIPSRICSFTRYQRQPVSHPGLKGRQAFRPPRWSNMNDALGMHSRRPPLSRSGGRFV